jgi:hypothetical protein
MFSGTVILIGSWMPAIGDQRFEGSYITGHVNATLQKRFVYPDLFLKAFDSLHVQIATFMRSTGDRKLARGKPVILHPTALHERKHLKWLGAGA